MESGKIQGTSAFYKKPYLFNSIKRNPDFVNKYLKNTGKLENERNQVEKKEGVYYNRYINFLEGILMRKRIFSALLAGMLMMQPAAGYVHAEAVGTVDLASGSSETSVMADETTEGSEASQAADLASESADVDSGWEITDEADREGTVPITGDASEGTVENTGENSQEDVFSGNLETEEAGFSDDGAEDVFGDDSAVSTEEFDAEPAVSLAEDEVVYDASTFDTFKNRSFEDVSQQYSAALEAGGTYTNNSSTWYQVPCSTSAPYAAGVLTQDTHNAMTAMTNFYRWLIGVQPLKAVSTNSDSLQAQALIRNFEFNHIVSASSKPSDMSDDLWNYGAPCTHNILAMGYNPRGAITGWMNEGYSLYTKSWDTLGHRYALISAYLSEVGFGYSGSIAIGADREYENEMTEAFAAFPAPGYMPRDLVYPEDSSWSVQLNTSKIEVEDDSKVAIKVTNLSTGNSYTCTSADDTAQVGSLISFVQPSDASGTYTDSYQVEITGLQDVETGKNARIQYTVKFADFTNSIRSNVKEVADDIEQYVIYKSMSDTKSLKKVAAILPTELRVVADSGMKTTIPVKGAWKVDTKRKCFVNSADARKLPSNLSDKNHLLDEITIPYVISDDYYDSYNNLSIVESQVSENDSVAFMVYRTNVSTNVSQIFKLNASKDGSYTASKKYDSTESAEFSAKESKKTGWDYFKKKKVTPEDAGEYISVYYLSDEAWGSSERYVSVSTKTLKVSHVYDKGKVTVAATAKKAGTKTYTCKYCGATKTETIPATGNTGSTVVKKPGKVTIRSLKTSSRHVVKITWKKVTGATGYQIYCRTGAKGKYKKIKTTTKTSYTHTKRKKGQKYYYKIRAYKKVSAKKNLYGSFSGVKSIKSK